MAPKDSLSEVVRTLAAVPYLAGLDPATLESVARVATRQECAAGQVLFVEGEPCAGLYVVERGWLKSVKMSPGGREQAIRFVGPKEVFNAAGVFSGAPCMVTVVALEPAVVWVVPRETMLKLVEQNPTLMRATLQHLAERAQHLLALVEDLSLRKVEARLARFLLQQANEGVVQRQRWTTQAEIAAHLGTVPDVLNRALRTLVEEDLIQVERHQIVIRDRQGLQTRGELD